MTFTFRTGTLSNLTHEQLGIELDRSLPRLYDSHSALDGIAIKAPALNGSFSVMSGVTTVTGSKLSIPTGLATIAVVTASQNSGKTATNFTVSANPSASIQGAIDIYVWQPTAAGNTTPTACTTAVPIHWWVTGTSTTST